MRFSMRRWGAVAAGLAAAVGVASAQPPGDPAPLPPPDLSSPAAPPPAQPLATLPPPSASPTVQAMQPVASPMTPAPAALPPAATPVQSIPVQASPVQAAPPQPPPTTPAVPTGNPPQTAATPMFAAPPLAAPAVGPAATTPAVATPASPAAAMLSVKQALPDSVIPGQPVVAEVTVTNTGGKSAENVVLAGWWTNGYDLTESSVVAQAVNGRRAWGLGAIAAGESRSLKVKLSPQPNTAANEFRSGFDATFSSATDTRSVKVTKPELQLTLTAPEVVFVGQPVPVQLRIKNPSQVPVSGVSIVTRLPETLAHPKGNNLESDLSVIQVGATETVALDVTAARVGEGRARVRVTAAGCDPIEQEVKFTAMEARVAVTLNGPKALYRDWPATYEAVIENQGDQPIKAAAFEVKLPAGFADLRASDKPGYDAASHRIVWKFDALQPGEKKTVIWFGFAKQSEDLQTVGTLSVSGMPLKRGEWTTKNMGAEAK